GVAPPSPARLRIGAEAAPSTPRAPPLGGGGPRLRAGAPGVEAQGGPPPRPRRQRAVTQPAATTSSSTSQLGDRVWTTIAVVGTTRPPSAATRASWLASA